MPPEATGRHETSHPGTKVIPSSSARRRAGPMPANESWSVRARALHPASAASSTTCPGESLPSETVEWVCRSITPVDATGSAGPETVRQRPGRSNRTARGPGLLRTPWSTRSPRSMGPAGEPARPDAGPSPGPTSLEWHGEVIVWPNRGEGRARRPPVCAVTNR